MGTPITFMCDGCQATLTVPAELAGISGPCPYCAKVITSPRHETLASLMMPAPAMAQAPAVPAPARIAAIAHPVARADVQTRMPHAVRESMANGAGRKVRKIHPALWAAAGIAAFAGGVASVWNLWPPSAKASPSPERADRVAAAFVPSAAPGGTRPSVLATADDSEPDAKIPPPSDTKPAVMAAPTAVARNVSTSAAPVAAPALTEEPSPVVTVASSETEAMRAVRKVVPLGGPLARPGEAIIRFMGAATWQERLKTTQAAEKMKPLMEAYYRAGGDGPIIPESVDYVMMEATEENPKFYYYAYMVFLPGRPTGIPLSVEDTAQGTRVEWRTFIECKDDLLTKFHEAPATGPSTFRAHIRRGHYFDDDVPNQDRMRCLELTSPDAATTFKIWAPLDSPVYQRYFANGERARWDVSSRMTLTLEWQKEESGVAWVRLRDVVAESWHPDLLPAGAAK